MTPAPSSRPRLSRERVLAAAVALADRDGVDGLSMRRLAHELDVVPMALYKHVSHKEDLLDGMVDTLVGEIEAPDAAADWRAAVRARVLSARRVLLRHPWARPVLESRTRQTPTALGYVDAVIGDFRAGGFSDDLTHHVMHALGSRMWGFTQELFDDGAARGRAGSPPAGEDPPADATPSPAEQAAMRALAERFPNVAAVARAARHDDGTVVGAGCDDQAEFEFALDLMLDGFARLQATGWTSDPRP